jgi:tRNA(Met) cytidine acetyltransferase
VNQLHRSITAIHSSFSAFIDNYHELLPVGDTLWLTDLIDKTVETTPFKQAHHKLGQEVDNVVFDLTSALEANALGAISGCIKGGGKLFLILPEEDINHKQSLFYQRLLKILEKHEVAILKSAEALMISLAPSSSQKSILLNEQPQATLDQQETVEAIKKVVSGHRKRPLVITSNRGRGKSSAIGMAVNEMLSEQTMKIIVCAPTRAMVAPLFQFAGAHDGLSFVAADKLVKDLPSANLVIIDEAGAIPVPVLSKLLAHYSRMVFSTTLHGYEGSGRGFAIRFYKQLNQQTPQWRSIELNDPIRWGDGDPLEKLTNDLLLLDAEPAELVELPESISDNLNYQRLSTQQLLNDESLLRQLFGLLVIAHYQTRPSDLVRILDDKQISIHALLTDNQIVATAIISHEGGLDSELSSAIYRGERRPKGHLVPQILLSQVGLPDTASLKTDRVMRIATHEQCRRKKLASELLTKIATHSSADYLSTSFGLSEELFTFWRQTGYKTVYIGLKSEASSGYHSAVMLKAISEKGQKLQRLAIETFARNFTALLGDSLREFSPELAYQLLSHTPQSNVDLSQQEIRDINRFASRQCGLDSSLAALQHWLPRALANNEKIINNNEALLLVMRILQHHSWSQCCQALGINGKQMAQQAMQQTVSILVKQSPGLDVSKDGLTRR